MNFYDSEKMAEIMNAKGFDISSDVEESDLVILNTCHIREKASEKMYSELGRIRKVKEERKQQGKNTIIAVAGCVAQAEGAEIKKRAPYIDVIIGPQSIQRLPELVNNAEAGEKRGMDLEFSVINKFDYLDAELENEKLNKEKLNANHQDKYKHKSSAFLTIQEGCDKFCSFCVVPYTRGAEYSRSVEEIYREAIKLVENGAKEINLLGQNVNAYHGKAYDGSIYSLGKLADHLAKISGLERIRYTTSHPRDVDDELILAHKYNEKLMPFVHLPVQSGSDKILKEMNRKHTRDEYFRIIDKFREVRPDIEFSSDFIIGHPGETEQDFEDTIDLIKRVKFSLSYSFIYSARPGTPASTKEDDTPKKIKTERLKIIQKLLEEQMFDCIRDKIGKKLPVLINRKGKFEGHYVGFTPYMQPVIIENAEEHFNQIVMAEMLDIKDRSLMAEMI